MGALLDPTGALSASVSGRRHLAVLLVLAAPRGAVPLVLDLSAALLRPDSTPMEQAHLDAIVDSVASGADVASSGRLLSRVLDPAGDIGAESLVGTASSLCACTSSAGVNSSGGASHFRICHTPNSGRYSRSQASSNDLTAQSVFPFQASSSTANALSASASPLQFACSSRSTLSWPSDLAGVLLHEPALAGQVCAPVALRVYLHFTLAQPNVVVDGFASARWAETLVIDPEPPERAAIATIITPHEYWSLLLRSDAEESVAASSESGTAEVVRQWISTFLYIPLSESDTPADVALQPVSAPPCTLYRVTTAANSAAILTNITESTLAASPRGLNSQLIRLVTASGPGSGVDSLEAAARALIQPTPTDTAFLSSAAPSLAQLFAAAHLRLYEAALISDVTLRRAALSASFLRLAASTAPALRLPSLSPRQQRIAVCFNFNKVPFASTLTRLLSAHLPLHEYITITAPLPRAQLPFELPARVHYIECTPKSIVLPWDERLEGAAKKLRETAADAAPEPYPAPKPDGGPVAEGFDGSLQQFCASECFRYFLSLHARLVADLAESNRESEEQDSVPLVARLPSPFEGALFLGDDVFFNFSAVLTDSIRYPRDQQWSFIPSHKVPQKRGERRENYPAFDAEFAYKLIVAEHGAAHTATVGGNAYRLHDAFRIVQMHPRYRASFLAVFGDLDTWTDWKISDVFYLPLAQLAPYVELCDWLLLSQSERTARLSAMQLPPVPPEGSGVPADPLLAPLSSLPPVWLPFDPQRDDEMIVIDYMQPGVLELAKNITSATAPPLFQFARRTRRGLTFCETTVPMLLALAAHAALEVPQQAAISEYERATALLNVRGRLPVSDMPVLNVWSSERNDVSMMGPLMYDQRYVYVHPYKLSNDAIWASYERAHARMTHEIAAFQMQGAGAGGAAVAPDPGFASSPFPSPLLVTPAEATSLPLGASSAFAVAVSDNMTEEVHDVEAMQDQNALLQLLIAERERIRSGWLNSADFTSPGVRFHSFEHRSPASPATAFSALSSSLTTSYFRARATERGASFTIGVSGGSSSNGLDTWVTRLQEWFAVRIGLEVQIRIASQGATSQLMTAPCLHEIVGDLDSGQQSAATAHQPLDLLLWEFAMNDEFGWLQAHQSDGRGDDARSRSAEIYLREAMRDENRPLAVGFLHLWDLRIHEWDWSQPRELLPDGAWLPTNRVLQHFAPEVDSFAVNTVRFLSTVWCTDDGAASDPAAAPSTTTNSTAAVAGAVCFPCADRKCFLRDIHHPNALGYDAAADLLALAILDEWIAGLQADMSTISAHAHLPAGAVAGNLQPAVRQSDLTLPPVVPGDVLPMPSAEYHAECILSSTPIFGGANLHLQMLCMSDEAASSGSSTISIGVLNFTTPEYSG